MGNKESIKTVIIDDELRALNRMKILLKNFPEIEVEAQITSPEQGLQFLLENEPDLIFLDVEMPDLTGLEIAEEINKRVLKTKIVFVTSHDHYAIKAIKNDAFDYLLKPVSIDELKIAIERFKAKLHSNLSKREFEIIGFIGEGLNSRAIAEELHISRHTVDTYRRQILDKTNCRNAAELIKFAAKNNLI